MNEQEFRKRVRNQFDAAKGLFKTHGLSQYVLDNYYLFHIESPDLMVADIDTFVATGKRPQM